VSQGLAQQRDIAKRDPYFVLQLLQPAGGDLRIGDETAAAATGTDFAYEVDFSCMYSQACPTVVIFSASSSGISRPVFSSNA
jgi:hypothetical protein